MSWVESGHLSASPNTLQSQRMTAVRRVSSFCFDHGRTRDLDAASGHAVALHPATSPRMGRYGDQDARTASVDGNVVWTTPTPSPPPPLGQRAPDDPSCRQQEPADGVGDPPPQKVKSSARRDGPCPPNACRLQSRKHALLADVVKHFWKKLDIRGVRRAGYGYRQFPEGDLAADQLQAHASL